MRLSYRKDANIGCVGFCGRTAVTARTVLPGIKVGTMLHGIVPLCSQLKGIGLVDNFVFWKDLGLKQSDPEYYKVTI